MSWSEIHVESGFSGGEETVRFGPRQESGSSLYQVDTLATIENKGQESPIHPVLNATACSNKLALTVENQVLLFDDTCSQCHAVLPIDAKIDAVGWSPDGNFLACADRKGFIYFISAKAKSILLKKDLTIKKSFTTTGPCFVTLMFILGSDGLYNLIVVGRKTLSFRFSCMDLKALHKAIDSGNLAACAEIQGKIKFSTIDQGQYHTDVSCAAEIVSFGNPSLLIGGSGDHCMSVWSLGDVTETAAQDAICYHSSDAAIMKCVQTADEEFIVTLDSSKRITIWTTDTFFEYDSWSEYEVEDFILFSTTSVDTSAESGNLPTEDLKIVILTTPQDGKCDLKVFSFGKYAHIYTLQISACSTLANVSINQESITFIEGVSLGLDDSMDEQAKPCISSVRVRSLTEALPENRLSRLLHRRKFDQAEIFAKSYDLDAQLVYKVKSTYLLDKLDLNQCNAGSQYMKDVDELKKCLDKIEDLEHIVKCCLTAHLPTLRSTYNLLNYAHEKINFAERSFTKSSDLFQNLIEGLNRLATFEVAFGVAQFNPQNWAQFLNSSLLDKMISCYSSNNVNAGIVIWRKHQSEFINELTIEKLNLLLQAIPSNTSSAKIIPWLREDFVPCVLNVLPEGQSTLANWLEQTARGLELSEKEFWPANALELASVMFAAFSSIGQATHGKEVATPIQFATKTCKLSIPLFTKPSEEDAAMEHSAAMVKLGNLVKSLREVAALHDEYKCKISLSQFAQENTKNIAFRLLNRVAAAELVPETIRLYVKPYASKNNLKLDILLADWVREHISHTKVLAVMWEPKVIAVIKEIDRLEHRCNATLKLMAKASSPWSAAMEQLVASVMHDCPDNEDLIRASKHGEVKKIMAKYSIRDTNVSDNVLLTDIIKYMFSTDIPTALEDALEISKAMPDLVTSKIYYMCMMSYINDNKLVEACSLIQSLACSDAVDVAGNMLEHAKSCISVQPIDDEDMGQYTESIAAIILVLESLLLSDHEVTFNYKDELEILKRILLLQREFTLFLSYDAYTDFDTRKELLHDYLNHPDKYNNKVLHVSEEKKNKKRKYKEISSVAKLSRFGELLGIADDKLSQILVDIYCTDQKFKELYDVADEVFNIPSSKKKFMHANSKRLDTLYNAAYILSTCDDDNMVQIASALYEFSGQFTSLCSDGDLCDFLLLSKLLRLTSQVVGQCEKVDYKTDSNSFDSDTVRQQCILEEYQDNGLALNSNEILPLIKKLIKLCTKKDAVGKEQVNDESQLEMILDVTREIADCLQDSNQQRLALQFYLMGLSICLQQENCFHMGLSSPVKDEVEGDKEENKLCARTSEKIADTGSKVLKEDCAVLLRLVLSHRVVDHDLALAFLDIFTIQEGMKQLSTIRNQFAGKFSRIQSIVKVAMDIAALRNEPDRHERCCLVWDCAYWGKKLMTLNIVSHDIYSLHSDEDEKRRILYLLVCHKDVDLETIQAYCKAFGYNEMEAILIFVKALLVNPEQFKGEPSTSINYQDQVDGCISYLPTTTDLERLFNTILPKISPYDYERLIYVFLKVAEITEDSNARMQSMENVSLLKILMRYERTSQPGESETGNDGFMEEEERMFMHGLQSSKVEKRLPFHNLVKGKPWSVLEPEIVSEEAVKYLLPVVSKLNLDKDQVRTIAIKNMVKKSTQVDGKLKLDFEGIHRLLYNFENIELACGTGKWFVQQIPRGDEKAKALLTCVNLSRNFAETVAETNAQKKERAMKMHKLFIDLHHRMSTQCTLQDYGITDNAFIGLCNDPWKLIKKLYEEYGDKAEFGTGTITGIPAIHEIAEKIAEINSIDLSILKNRLIEMWLPWVHESSSEGDDMDMLLSSSQSKNQSVVNEKNLKRAMYVLARDFDLTNVDNLLGMAFQNTEDTIALSPMSRIRAVQALFTLFSPSIIQERSGKPINEIRETLINYLYLAELESLHISHSTESFRTCNKEALIKGLWRNHSHEAKGIRLIADLCLDYKILDPKLWNNLLQKLLSFNMISYLKHVLVTLSAIPKLREIPCLIKMWKTVTTQPLSTASVPLSPEDEKECLEAAYLLRRCPVVIGIGLPEIAQLLKKVGFLTQSMMYMTLIPDEELRTKSIKNLLEEIGWKAMLEQIAKERVKGGYDGHLDSVEEEVYDFINTNNYHEGLMNSPYFEKLIGFLVRSNKINTILLKALTASKIERACELVQLHMSVHTQSRIALMTKNENLSSIQSLWAYLENEGLLAIAHKYLPPICDDSTLYQSTISDETMEDLTDTDMTFRSIVRRANKLA